MARNCGHYVRTGLGIVGAVFIDIQLWKLTSCVFYDSMRVWSKERYE